MDTTTTTTTTTSNGLEQEALASAAFARVLPDLLALREDELSPINLDIPAAVITVLGVLGELKELRPRLAKLSELDITEVDKLEDYALALSFANARYLAATKTPNDLETLATEAAKLRERLLAEARAFTYHGIISESQLANLKGANGKKNVATDLQVLAGLLQEAWPQIQGKTPTTPQDLERASRIATRLQRIMGVKEQGPAQASELTDQRLRAYNKLVDVYETIQLAVAFLRGRRNTADTIVPNLHPGRPGPRNKPTDEPPAPPSPSPSVDEPPTTDDATPDSATTAKKPNGPFMT